MTDNKRFRTIDEYISTFPAETQAVLEKVRQAIQKAVPEAAETMSYGMPTYSRDGTAEIALEAGAEVYSRPLKGYGDALRQGFLFRRVVDA